MYNCTLYITYYNYYVPGTYRYYLLYSDEMYSIQGATQIFIVKVLPIWSFNLSPLNAIRLTINLRIIQWLCLLWFNSAAIQTVIIASHHCEYSNSVNLNQIDQTATQTVIRMADGTMLETDTPVA